MGEVVVAGRLHLDNDDRLGGRLGLAPLPLVARVCLGQVLVVLQDTLQ